MENETNIKELTEGTYKAASGYELISGINKTIIVKKIPDFFQEYDIVWLSECHMAMIRKYNGNNSCKCYVDFLYYVDESGNVNVKYFYTYRDAVYCEFIKETTEKDKAFFMDVINAFGWTYNDKEFVRLQHYFPVNYEYGVMIKDGQFVAIKLSDCDIDDVLYGNYRKYKFETLRAAKICAFDLNKKIER